MEKNESFFFQREKNILLTIGQIYDKFFEIFFFGSNPVKGVKVEKYWKNYIEIRNSIVKLKKANKKLFYLFKVSPLFKYYGRNQLWRLRI